MAMYAVKTGSESNERLVNRFKRQFNESGVQKMKRATDRRAKPMTKRMVRMAALKREENRARNTKKKFYSNM